MAPITHENTKNATMYRYLYNKSLIERSPVAYGVMAARNDPMTSCIEVRQLTVRLLLGVSSSGPDGCSSNSTLSSTICQSLLLGKLSVLLLSVSEGSSNGDPRVDWPVKCIGPSLCFMLYNLWNYVTTMRLIKRYQGRSVYAPTYFTHSLAAKSQFYAHGPLGI
jgi:hypothetical protein